MNKLECLIDKMESSLVSLSDGRLEHKKIYVAGKISGLPRKKVVAKFNRARKSLLCLDKTVNVFLPTVLPDLADVSHADYLHVCFSMIDVCTHVYMLSDWMKSKGAIMEFLYASAKGKTIMFEGDTLYCLMENNLIPCNMHDIEELAEKILSGDEKNVMKITVSNSTVIFGVKNDILESTDYE